MRQVVSFRLPKEAVAALRTRAARSRQKFTNYIESLVMKDLDETNARAPSQPYALRVLRTIQQHRADLEKIGVVHAALFGSVARGEDSPDSDVDILVELDPLVVRDLIAYSSVHQRLEELIGRPVDVARRDKLRPDVEQEIARDVIRAF